MSVWLINLVTAIYLYVGVEQTYKGQWEFGLMYVGYAIANIALAFAINKGLMH